MDGEAPVDGENVSDDQNLEPFKLVFIEGAQACARFSESRTALQELSLKGRVTFHPGTITLPRNSDVFEADLLDQVQVIGPNPVQATEETGGEIEHRFESGLWGSCHRYVFTQQLLADTRLLIFKFTFSFCVKDGVPDPDTLHFDSDLVGEEPKGLVDDTQLELIGFLDDGQNDGDWDYATEKQFYGSCSYNTIPLYQIAIDFENGDSVDLDKRYLKPFMASGPTLLIQATIVLNGQQAAVDDYFHLSYAADLHNFNERYLLVLQSPIGDVHGLYFAESSTSDNPPQKIPPTVVKLLGQDLNPNNSLEERQIQNYSDTKVE
jgi:hypothetical protein